MRVARSSITEESHTSDLLPLLACGRRISKPVDGFPARVVSKDLPPEGAGKRQSSVPTGLEVVRLLSTRITPGRLWIRLMMRACSSMGSEPDRLTSPDLDVTYTSIGRVQSVAISWRTRAANSSSLPAG